MKAKDSDSADASGSPDKMSEEEVELFHAGPETSSPDWDETSRRQEAPIQTIPLQQPRCVTWAPIEMSGIDPAIICRRLTINLGSIQ